jgi:signal transduction histidine kinase/CheY-like chemotaxis protein
MLQSAVTPLINPYLSVPSGFEVRLLLNLIWWKEMVYVALLVLLFCAAPGREALAQPLPRSGVVSGVYTIASEPPSNQAFVKLSGEWWYRHGVLLAPGAADSSMRIRSFPFLWTSGTQGELPRPPFGVATYKLLLRTNTPVEHLGLDLPDMYSAFALYVDTHLVATNGRVAASPEGYEPKWLPMVAELPVIRDSTWITLHIANFSHAKGGIVIDILLGPAEYLRWRRDFRLAFDWLLAGSLLLSGLFMIGIFLLSRGDRAMLFFGLVSVTWSYRVIGYGSYALHTILPGLSWHTAIHVEYLTLFFTAGWFVLYVYGLFPVEASRVFLYISAVIVATFSVIVLLTPTHVFTQLINPFFYFLLIALMYGVSVYIRAAISGKRGARISLVATAILFLLFSYNILAYFGVTVEKPAITFFGYFTFFGLQSIILGTRYAGSLQGAVQEMKELSDLKGRFLAQMSHELRTPLNAIIGYAQILNDDKSLGPRPKKHVEILQHSAQHLLSMINEILDFSRLEEGQVKINRNSFRIEDLADSLQRLFQLQADEKGLSFRVAFENGHEVIRTDEMRLRQILINLIGNAIKFTDRGEISLKLALIKGREESATLVGTVRDTGRGIPADELESIFEPFRQVANRFSQGTGLGLAITRRLLDLLQGSVHVDSTVEKGSVFTVRIPVQVVKSQQLPVFHEPSQPTPGLTSGLRVLVVDDVAANGELLNEMLKNEGAACTLARSAKEADALFAPDRFDVCLLDLHMPDVDGIQLLAQWKLTYGEAMPPCLAVTADVTYKSELIRDSGFAGLVYKPFELQRLIASITSALASGVAVPQIDSPRELIRQIGTLELSQRIALVDALSTADMDSIEQICPGLPDGVLKETLSLALKNRNFQKLMEIGLAAENQGFGSDG